LGGAAVRALGGDLVGVADVLVAAGEVWWEYLHIYHHYDMSGIKNTMSVTHVSVTQCKMSSVIMVNM
jgi:hypothetical protein